MLVPILMPFLTKGFYLLAQWRVLLLAKSTRIFLNFSSWRTKDLEIPAGRLLTICSGINGPSVMFSNKGRSPPAPVSQGGRCDQRWVARSRLKQQITVQSSNIDQWERGPGKQVAPKKGLFSLFCCVLAVRDLLLCPAASLHSSRGLCQVWDTEVATRSGQRRWPGRRRASQACPPLLFSSALYFSFPITLAGIIKHAKSRKSWGHLSSSSLTLRASKGQNLFCDGRTWGKCRNPAFLKQGSCQILWEIPPGITEDR